MSLTDNDDRKSIAISSNRDGWSSNAEGASELVTENKKGRKKGRLALVEKRKTGKTEHGMADEDRERGQADTQRNTD